MEAARGSSVFIPNDVGMKNDSRLAIVTGKYERNEQTEVLVSNILFDAQAIGKNHCNTVSSFRAMAHRTADLKGEGMAASHARLESLFDKLKV